ncbi:MAG: hypothetical protein FJ217_10705 [Ignavibacteria bacterium]|nr:hypothetical protein [Ignavibacteria bacterium]
MQVNTMKHAIVALVFVMIANAQPFLLPSSQPAETAQLGPGLHEFSIVSAGHEWTYLAYVPTRADSNERLPTVLILHGAGGSGEGYLERAGWREKAEQEGFIAIAPDGLPARPTGRPSFLLNPRLWNTGQLREGSPRTKVDDIQFFKDLLNHVRQRVKLDAHRIYVTGHSNGAGMTFRLAHEMAERFAAIAPVASLCWIEEPKPARPLPTLYMIGTEDPLVPLAGGESRLPWGRRTTPPVETTLRKWSVALGCNQAPRTVRDDSTVQVLEYGPCDTNVPFTVWFIKAQGHEWPGGEAMLPGRIMGPSRMAVRATDVIWEFFKSSSSPSGPLE